MKSLGELKKLREESHSALFKECGVFFAFSNNQFDENKTPLKEGEKYVSLGAGGYVPKGQLDNYFNGLDRIHKEYKDAIKDNNLRNQNIRYELSNHEAFYTGEIDDTLLALGDDYTAEEVYAVYCEGDN